VLLTLLAISPRVAPGLLTRDAWRALERADRVISDSPATADALRAADIDAELVEDLAAALDHGGGTAGPEGRRTVVLADPGTVEQLRRRLPGSEALHASYDVPGGRLLDLVGVMDRLRTECPWDREQSHRSLARYLLEETYETLEAIETGDTAHLQEELGDLLLQVCFHARIAAEQGEAGFDIDDVAGGIVDKLVYRHPHVFAGLDVADADEVDRNWETLKAAEKKRTSPLEGIPAAMPALAYADKVVGRLAKVESLPGPESGSSVGERLLDLVRTAHDAGLDPEQELRNAVRRLVARASLDGGSGRAV
jgi:XTP/dITP diphosphohydrolase